MTMPRKLTVATIALFQRNGSGAFAFRNFAIRDLIYTIIFPFQTRSIARLTHLQKHYLSINNQ